MLKVKFWFVWFCRYVEIEPAGQTLPGAGLGKTAPVFVFWQLSRLNAAHQKARASGPPPPTGGTSWLPPAKLNVSKRTPRFNSHLSVGTVLVGYRPAVEVGDEAGRDFGVGAVLGDHVRAPGSELRLAGNRACERSRKRRNRACHDRREGLRSVGRCGSKRARAVYDRKRSAGAERTTAVAVAAIRILGIDDHGRRFARHSKEVVVHAGNRGGRVTSLDAHEVLRVDLILEVRADAAGVRVELVVGSATARPETIDVGVRVRQTPRAVERIAVDAQKRGRAEVLRVLQLSDDRLVVETGTVTRGTVFGLRERSRIYGVGKSVVGHAMMDRVQPRAAERAADRSSDTTTGASSGIPADRTSRLRTPTPLTPAGPVH